ncbi:FecR family protein [Rugamonas sp. DEMB1]|uniref:FecR family protein n=1 Tax=Rugamonas sp. DEMB1 TaxID=3039386 RepID=UPI0024499F37|nr:FecR domain-containing protein [Rugamonas sp. DEMB1]WGG52146.1 FecR domain-containing protein [Rugamonas sp. DEMB1]
MSSHAEIEARAADWIAARDGARWDAAQQGALDAWLGAATAHRVAFLRLDAVWRDTARLRAMAPQPQAQQQQQQQPAVRPLRPQRPAWRLAAGLLLALGLAGGAAVWRGAAPELSYAVAHGARQNVRLADGSQLVLNTDTRLRSRVDARQRTVWLDRGEAYFDIAHDPAHPFVIEAGTQRITVLGTRFSVRRDKDLVRVEVVGGRVKVETVGAARPRDGAATVLGQNELVVADAEHVLVGRKSAEQIARDLSWRQGRLVLDQMTLGQAAEAFNRYNHKRLRIVDQATAELRIGGSFEVGNVEAFARLLQQGFGLTVRDGRDEILVSR